jgi:hypothetical protein
MIWGNTINGIFVGRDCRFTWQRVSTFTGGTNAGNEMSGAGVGLPEFGWVYEIIIKTLSGKTLRTALVQETEYTYHFEDNKEDAARLTPVLAPQTTFIIQMRGRDQWGRFSIATRELVVINPAPAPVSAVSAVGIVGGIRATWATSAEEDFSVYEYRTKIGSGSYSNWIDAHDNSVSRTMTSAEISTYGINAVITLDVRVRDCYNQTSTTVTTTAKANVISDSIFQITATDSGGSDVSKLHDGDIINNALYVA